MKKWKVNSWRDYPVKHIPNYEDEKDLNAVFPPKIFGAII